jgi:hypothetical protein
VWGAEQGPDEHITPPRFVDDGTAQGIVVVAEAGEALNEGTSAEIGTTGDYQPGGSPAVWESMISMISMGFGMWLPHDDGKSVIALFYDSFVATELRSKWKMENGKWKMEIALRR